MLDDTISHRDIIVTIRPATTATEGQMQPNSLKNTCSSLRLPAAMVDEDVLARYLPK